MLERIKRSTHRVKIGLVGKYVKLHDAYLSVAEALRHAGMKTARLWRSNCGSIPEHIDAKNVKRR
jgi:CTP synthase (UTP-ammonia lyase)